MPGSIGGSKVQADYDELAAIANQFAQESSAAEQLLNQITESGRPTGGRWLDRTGCTGVLFRNA